MIDIKKKLNNDKENISPTSTSDKGTFGDRLQLLIGNESGRKFAARANITYSTLHNYLTNISVPTLDNLIKLAKITNVDLNWLAMGRGNPPRYPYNASQLEYKPYVDPVDSSGNLINTSDFYFVPQYSIKTENDNVPVHPVSLSKHWIDNTLLIDPIGLVSLEVQDDSMSPEFNDKDMVLVNTQDTTLRHGIYVLQIRDSLIIRRIQMLFNNHIKITSSNPIYDPIQLNINELPSDFSVVGRVVWFGRTVP